MDADVRDELSVGASLGRAAVRVVPRANAARELLSAAASSASDEAALLVLARRASEGGAAESPLVWDGGAVHAVWADLRASPHPRGAPLVAEAVIAAAAGGAAAGSWRVVAVVEGAEDAEDAAELSGILPPHFTVLLVAAAASRAARGIKRRSCVGGLGMAELAARTVTGQHSCAPTAEQIEEGERRHAEEMARAVERAKVTARLTERPHPPTSEAAPSAPAAAAARPRAESAALAADAAGGRPPPALHIVHFNDVYNVESTRTRDPVGGADRFLTVVKSLRHLDPVVLFSGDCFSPSIVSTVTRGAHMVPVLNEMGIDCACVGNHDVDGGVPHLEGLIARTSFPWLLSNVRMRDTGLPMARAGVTRIVTSASGVRVGLMGLAEREWIDTLTCVSPDEIEYDDFCEAGERLAAELREAGADVVVALTHMRQPNDEVLARRVRGIDLVLGGHDHFYSVREIAGCTVVKSDSDFRALSLVRVWLGDAAGGGADVNQGARVGVSVDRLDVNESVPPDPDMRGMVAKLTDEVKAKLNVRVGTVTTALDARFQTVRLRESNVGNLMADVVRRAYRADVGFIVGGTIRSDDTYGPGDISMSDVLRLFPFDDPCVVLRVTGADLVAALENGFSSTPKMDGRFPQVSGMRVVYDPRRPPGERVTSVAVGDRNDSMAPVDPAATYTMATRGYLRLGKDGFSMLARPGQVVMDEENGHLCSVLLRNFFWTVDLVNKLRRKKRRATERRRAAERYGLGGEGGGDAEEVLPQIEVGPVAEGRIMTVEEASAASGPARLTRLASAVDRFNDLSEAPALLRQPSDV